VAAFIANTSGTGETLFLNADFSAMAQLAQPEAAETVATDMALRLARFGVLPEYTLVGHAGRANAG